MKLRALSVAWCASRGQCSSAMLRTYLVMLRRPPHTVPAAGALLLGKRRAQRVSECTVTIGLGWINPEIRACLYAIVKPVRIVHIAAFPCHLFRAPFKEARASSCILSYLHPFLFRMNPTWQLRKSRRAAAKAHRKKTKPELKAAVAAQAA